MTPDVFSAWARKSFFSFAKAHGLPGCGKCERFFVVGAGGELERAAARAFHALPQRQGAGNHAGQAVDQRHAAAWAVGSSAAIPEDSKTHLQTVFVPQHKETR